MVVGGVDQVLVVGSKMEHGDEPYLARKVVSSLRPGPLRAMPADKLASRLAAPFSLSLVHIVLAYRSKQKRAWCCTCCSYLY